jgi:hypothetical protein
MILKNKKVISVHFVVIAETLGIWSTSLVPNVVLFNGIFVIASFLVSAAVCYMQGLKEKTQQIQHISVSHHDFM